METTNTTPRFTINNLKQEIKDLAKLQHEEKLFFKHPDRYPGFLKENMEIINAENHYQPIRDPEKIWSECSRSQSRCEERRGKLARMNCQYYALKHWKKLNMDDDLSLAQNYLYLENEYEKNYREDLILEACTEKKYHDPDYDSQREDLYKRYRNKEMDTKAYYAELDKLPKATYVDFTRKSLLKLIDKEA